MILEGVIAGVAVLVWLHFLIRVGIALGAAITRRTTWRDLRHLRGRR